MTLKEAQARIAELEQQVADLTAELEYYKSKPQAGRRVHDETWQKSFDLWVDLHEAGRTLVEVMDATGMSRRTYYRYKAYYEQLQQMPQDKEDK